MLPNIRKLYIPDPGYTLFDIDLASADLRIVTWESDCKLMKEWFHAGYDPYTMVAREYYRDPSLHKDDPRRQKFKSLCHATNYLGLAENIAGNSNIGLGVAEVARVQQWYFTLFPEIKKWQDNLIETVNKERTIRNAFGYTFTFLGRLDKNSYNEAAAWVPQSTVGILINHAMVNIDKSLPEVQLLLQVHDSLVGQYPTSMPEMREQILAQSRIEIPYADPLIIPVGINTSEKSWGDCA